MNKSGLFGKKDSAVKVLLVGNNPNILFYTSRFQLGKNVELYHVSESKSNAFDVETKTYGAKHFSVDNHFTSLANLAEALESADELSDLKLDFIVVSATSLKELASLPAQLQPFLGKHTSIFIESSGFLQLESFLRNSKELSSCGIFSIMTNYDIRQIANNQYKQFSTNSEAAQTIYVGAQVPGNSASDQQKKKKKSKGLSLKDSSSAKYSSDATKALGAMTNLLEKLFQEDTVSNCHKSPAEFMATQWALAMPRICLDPLLVIFQQTAAQAMVDEVLAKPLISGIITEMITISKSSGVKLDSKIDNEDKIIENWLAAYKGQDIPALLYNYVQHISDLNLDLLLLQPILLADDFDIKTPYLEFLYTIMCQMDKLNNGKSEWFVRADALKEIQQECETLTRAKNQSSSDLQTANQTLNQVQQDLAARNAEINHMKGEYEAILLNKNREIMQLQQRVMSATKIRTMQNSGGAVISPDGSNHESDDFHSTHENSRSTPDVAGTTADSSILANSSAFDLANADETKEQELERRERELRERQDAFERKMSMQQQRSPQFQSPMQYPQQLQASPHLYHNNTNGNGFPLQPPMHNLPQIRTMTPPERSTPVFSPHSVTNKSAGNTPTMSVGKFVDPVSAGNMDMNNSFENPDFRHPIIPTNRKNKKNRNTTIGNASSSSLGAIVNSMPSNNHVTDRSFSTSSGMMNTSGNSMLNTSGTNLNMMRAKHNTTIDMPRPTRMNNLTGSPDLSTPTKPNMQTPFNANISTDSATNDTTPMKKPVMQFGLGIHSQTSLVTPLDKTTVPTNIEPTHFNTENSQSKDELSNVPEQPAAEVEEDTSKDKGKKKKLKFGLFGKKKKKN